MADFDSARTPGSFGQPPPHAPREVADNSPLGLAATASQVAEARRNEKSLAPLSFESSPRPRPTVNAAPIAVPVAQTTTNTPESAAPIITSSFKPVDIPIRKAGRFSRLAKSAVAVVQQVIAPVVEEAPAAPVPVAEPVIAPAAAVPADPARPSVHQPAFSNTDSPSRGVPRPIDDPGKRITGGFGDLGEAQYFPLDGTELRELVYALMDQVHRRLADDLRFSIAVTYPRVAARVVVEVQAFGNDQSFQVPCVMPPHTHTPLDIAREYGDEIVFVVVAERREMTDEGESITPPNQTRSELGLEIPRKRMIQAGAAKIMVDRES